MTARKIFIVLGLAAVLLFVAWIGPIVLCYAGGGH